MRAVWITLLAVVAFAIILVARMPASWVVPVPPAALSCTATDGTVWSGTCTGLTLQGLAVGDVVWELHPLKLLAGKIAAHVAVTRPGASAQGDLETNFSGRILTARNLKADLPLERALMPQLPANLRGNVHAELGLARIENGIVTDLKGHLEARDLQQVGSEPAPLGSYSLSFPGGSAEPTGELHDLGGPLSVQGTLRLTRAPGFDLQGMVSARASAPADLQKQIQYLGSPASQGRRPFSLGGTF